MIAHSLEDISAQLVATEPALLTSRDFGQYVHQGVGDCPSLMIGDQAEIPLFPEVTDSRKDYRMACLAEPSDLVVVRHRDAVFEAYLSDKLGISAVTFLEASSAVPGSVSKQARQSGPLGDALAKIAARTKGLTLKSYLTTGNTWRLARQLGDCAQTGMYVCGPSPRLTQRVNDKLWFRELVSRVIGGDATPRSMSAFGPAAAAGQVAYLAKHSAHVIVKVPDSAGSAGNITFDSAFLRGQRLRNVRDLLVQRMEALGWQGRFPVLIGVWDEDVTSSPSAQLWIPSGVDGPPIVEGIFEQHVQGAEGTFVGAARSTLPKDIQAQLSQEALRIAAVLQKIGYFSRCSMDAVICQPENVAPRVHWIECNGRWGGVSIPMTFANKLCASRVPDGFLILQDLHPELPGLNTMAYLDALGNLLLQNGSSREGIIVLSPPHSATGLSVNLLILAASQEAAEALATEVLSRLANTQQVPENIAHG